MVRLVPTVLLATLIAALIAGLAAAQPAAPSEAPPRARVRVGTFDARAIVVAYYRSDLSAEHMRELHAAHAAARAAGDRKQATRLEKEGEALQDLAHRQLAGEAALDNILERLRPRLGRVLDEADADLIIDGRLAHARPGVEVVDVTEPMLRALKADAATRRIIDDLRNNDRP